MPAAAADIANSPIGVVTMIARLMRPIASLNASTTESSGRLCSALMPLSAAPARMPNSTTAGSTLKASAWKTLDGM